MNILEEYKQYWHIVYVTQSMKTNWRWSLRFFILEGHNELATELELFDSVLN